MKRFILITILVMFATQALAVQCFVENANGNLNMVYKRMQNQFGIEFENDHNTLDNEGSKQAHMDAWPKNKSGWNFTKYEIDQADGTIWFNVDVPQELADALPRNDNPNFSASCETDEDFVLPTYKVENRDENGEPLGTYYDRAVTVMR